MIAGKYFGQVADAATRMSKNGNPQMIIEFEVTHISEGGQWIVLDSPVNRRIYISMSDAAWTYSVEKLLQLGWNADMKEPKFENATEGVELELKFETWEVADGGDGKEREKWDLMREKNNGNDTYN